MILIAIDFDEAPTLFSASKEATIKVDKLEVVIAPIGECIDEQRRFNQKADIKMECSIGFNDEIKCNQYLNL